MKYRGFTIEMERDGSYSVYHYAYHYLGNFKTAEEARKSIDWRMGA
jgi:hypothetical protein